MKKFKFRLERVLQYRELLRKEVLRELWQANQALSETEQRLSRLLQSERGNLMGTTGSQTAESALLFGHYGARLKAEIDSTRALLEVRQAEADAVLNKYIEAAKDSKSLETLKARRREAHAELILKEEEKFMDELSVQRYERI